MKTKMYFTLFALIIRVMVKSQTPANLAFQPTADFVLGYAHFTEAERTEFSNVEDPAELLLRAEKLIAEAEKINRKINDLPAEEKDKAMRKASELLTKAEHCKLAAYELTAYNNRMEFKLLKSSYVRSLSGLDQDNGLVKKSKQTFFTAVQTFRTARELREEAYAQLSTEATLANLENAEQREAVAFKKLVEAATLLEHASPQLLATK